MKANLIEFPTMVEKSKKKRKIIDTTGVKYFNEKQIKLLRRTVRDTKVTITHTREWMIIDILTCTGMRVAEAANIRCGDVRCGYGQSELFIRCGKCSRSRTIQIPETLKRHLNQFMKWKQERSEPTGDNDFLFIGQRGPIASQGIQQIVKKYLKQLGLYENGKSVHALRHSYAVQYYKQSHDLRGLQKQLGHASIQNTQIYADVTKEDIQASVEGLWR